VLKKVISIFLLAIMLLGNVGITYGTHFCMGMAMKSELMIGHEHMDCGMAMDESIPSESDQTHFSAPPCCENQYVSVETDDTFTKSLSLELANTFVAVTLSSILYTVEVDFSIDEPLANDTSPPLLKQDFIVLHQVFRI
jgi:hypothetical protein